jgi:subtilisin family serine protease
MACHFMKDVVATRADRAEEAQRLLDSDPLDEGSLNELMGGEIDREVLTQMTSLVTVFGVEGRDPHQLSRELREQGVEVSPIHALGTLNHIAYMTGTDPEPTEVKTSPEIAASSPGRIVAVIDTGVTESLPLWVESGLDFDQADIETLGGQLSASHGTFVAGLIRRIAPEHTISMARSRRWAVKDLEPKLEASHHDADDPSTELHVLEAMIRLVNRLGGRDRCDVAALNLSLGGSCDDHDPGFVTLRIALDHWRNSFPKVPIFAAGGNTPDRLEVYPGAFEFVRSVAAAKDGGEQVVWDRTASRSGPLTAPDRPWITDVAPGSDLVSPSGRTKSEWVKWSGSSFATAVATANYVSNRPMEASDGLIWWADRQTKPADIPGLVL